MILKANIFITLSLETIKTSNKRSCKEALGVKLTWYPSLLEFEAKMINGLVQTFFSIYFNFNVIIVMVNFCMIDYGNSIIVLSNIEPYSFLGIIKK